MTSRKQPTYLALHEKGELSKRAKTARRHLKSCDLCANLCRVNRLLAANDAICRTGEAAIIYSTAPHFGEEHPISGHNGSGTIFFSRCNLNCVFCQNYDISQSGTGGRQVSPETLADLMLQLQALGCHNINLVSASHVVAQTIEALAIAAEQGLHLPLVYNSGGYDSPAALELLDDIIDIYMPDMKCADREVAGRYLGVNDYPEVNRAATLEMHRQVGDLDIDANGIAQSGLLVRHLVLPNDLAGTKEIVDFLAEEISTDTYINIMGQYHPCYRTDAFPDLGRRPTHDEISRAHAMARQAGLTRIDGP